MILKPDQRQAIEFAYHLIMEMPGGFQHYADRLAAMLAKAEPTVIRVWIKDGLISDVLGLPDGVTLRIIDMDTEGTLDEDTKPIEGDDAVAAGGHTRAFISDYAEDTVPWS
jgi:hypothetical protein